MDLSGKNYKAFIERQEALKKQYSPANAEKQHSKGKLTAREGLICCLIQDHLKRSIPLSLPRSRLLSLASWNAHTAMAL